WVVHGHQLVNLAAKPAGAVFDLDAGVWDWLPEPGGVAGATPWPAGAVGGDEVAVSRGRAMELDRLRWFAIGRPDGAPDEFGMVWAGARLIAWGGDSPQGDFPQDHHMSNAGWEWTPPPFDPPRSGHISVHASGAVSGSAESSTVSCE